MKFVKIKHLVIPVDLIKTLRVNGQFLLVECTTDECFHVQFSSEFDAKDELNRVYTLLTLRD